MKRPQLRKTLGSHTLLASTLAWIAALAVAAVHTGLVQVLPYQQLTFMLVYPLTIMLPGAITMILLPAARRRWYRWVALGGLSLVVFPEVYPLVMLVGETWLLHQSWVTERHDAGPTKAAIRWPWKRTAPAVAKTSGPSTIAEALAAEKSASPKRPKKFPARGSSRPVAEDGA